MESQNKQIKEYLNHGNKITSLDAFQMFGCMRLASRINDLKNEGMRIGSKTIMAPNGKRYSEYYALSPEGNKSQMSLI
tara:strand:+ start:8812 stop:9045 length:234 start_codon:yes stop_codon:yes gene_type:complete